MSTGTRRLAKMEDSPKFVNQYAITLSGGHQVVLTLKGNTSWQDLLKLTMKPWHTEDYIFDWYISIIKLMNFERKHKIKFLWSKRYQKIYWKRR